MHGQEFNSFRKMRSKALHEFKLHRQEKFLYVCDTLHMWEWDVRVLDIQDGLEGDYAPICVGGRGAAPPEFCGGPTGYRLMLKRQREGAAMSDPLRLEAGVQMLAEVCPGQSVRSWDLLRTVLDEGFQSIDRRLHELGPLQPDRFRIGLRARNRSGNDSLYPMVRSRWVSTAVTLERHTSRDGSK